MLSRGHVKVVVLELADPVTPKPPNENSGAAALLITVSMNNSKGLALSSYSSAVFPLAKVQSSPLQVGDHYFFDNVLNEGFSLNVTLNIVNATDSKALGVIGSTTIPVSRLEEDVLIQQWYSLPPSSRAAVKLSLLYEKERVLTRPRSRSYSIRDGAEASNELKRSLSHRLSVSTPPTSPRNLPAVVESDIAPTTPMAVDENQRLIQETLSKIAFLEQQSEPSVVKSAGPAASPKPADKPQSEPETPENLPVGLVDYAVIFGPLTLAAHRVESLPPSSSTPNNSALSTSSFLGKSSSPLYHSSSPATSSCSVSSSLRALTESNTRLWDRFPIQDIKDSPLPGKIEWFACPEGCKWQENIERPDAFITSFVLTAGGAADELFGVCLNFFVATVSDCFETSSSSGGGVVPDDPPAWFENRWLRDQNAKTRGPTTPLPTDQCSRQWVCIRLCVLSRWPYYRQLAQCLRQIYKSNVLPLLVPWEYGLRLGNSEDTLPLRLDSVFSALCYQCPVPVPGVYQVSLRLVRVTNTAPTTPAKAAAELFQEEKVHLLLAAPRDLPMPPYPITALVEALGPRGTVNVLLCALSECKMLFHSENLGVLPPLCEALRALLYPLRWAHVYLPVVPAPLLDLMEAPVPFLLGTHTSWLRHISPDCLKDVVLVDCDSGAIDFGTAEVMQLPEEEDRWLVAAIKMIQNPLEANENSPHFELNNSTNIDIYPQPSSPANEGEEEDHNNIVRSVRIQAVVLDVLVSFLKGVPSCLFYLHASAPVFNRNLLLDTPNASRRKFLEQLTDTNAFHTFTEELTLSSCLSYFREALARVYHNGIKAAPLPDDLPENTTERLSAAVSSSRMPPPHSSPLRRTGAQRIVVAQPSCKDAEVPQWSETGLPDWLSSGRRAFPGKSPTPFIRKSSLRSLLDERLALYVPFVAWLRDRLGHCENSLHTNAQLHIENSTQLSPGILFSLALPAPIQRELSIPLNVPIPRNDCANATTTPLCVTTNRNILNGSLLSSISLRDGETIEQLVLPGTTRRNGCSILGNKAIEIQGISREEFLAHFLASAKHLTEEKGLSMQLASSKEAMLGFLVEQRNVNSSLQMVHRFLQQVIAGRGTEDELEERLQHCIASLLEVDCRRALVRLLREAKNHGLAHTAGGTGSHLLESCAFPLNTSMFHALSRCFQAYLKICVAQEDFLSAYQLLEVGGLYYMRTTPAVGGGDDSEKNTYSSNETEIVDEFLSAHILQHPIYQASLLWLRVLHHNVFSGKTEGSASLPGGKLTKPPPDKSPPRDHVLSEARNCLHIMASLGINFFRAMDFIQALQTAHSLKIDDYVDLSRCAKRMWAEEQQQLAEDFSVPQEVEQRPQLLSLSIPSSPSLDVAAEEERVAGSYSPSSPSNGQSTPSSGASAPSPLSSPIPPPFSWHSGASRDRTATVDLLSLAAHAATPSDDDKGSSNNISVDSGRIYDSQLENRYLSVPFDPALSLEAVNSAVCLGSQGDGFVLGCDSGYVMLASFRGGGAVKVKHGPDPVTQVAPLRTASTDTALESLQQNDCSSIFFATVCSNDIVKVWSSQRASASSSNMAKCTSGNYTFSGFDVPTCMATFKNHPIGQHITCSVAFSRTDIKVLVVTGDSAGNLRASIGGKSSAWVQQSLNNNLPSSVGEYNVNDGGAVSTITACGCEVSGAKDDVVVVGTAKGAIQVYDLLCGKAAIHTSSRLSMPSAHCARINALVFVRPNAFVSCSDDRGVSLWDLRVRNPVAFLESGISDRAGCDVCPWTCTETPMGPSAAQKAAYGAVTGLAVGGLDMSVVASASADCLIKVWDLRMMLSSRGGPSTVLRGHRGRVTAIAFDCFDRLQSCSLDGTVRTWDWVAGVPCDLTWVWGPAVQLTTSAFDVGEGHVKRRHAAVLTRVIGKVGESLKIHARQAP